MIRITINKPEGQLIEDFDSWDLATRFAYSHEWSEDVTVSFLTNGNFLHTLPLTDFTQAKDYVK